MKALLLAAGFGTRLRPITDTIPKCLVPIKQKPLLGYWLDLLFQNGIEEALVNTHYLPKVVEDFVNHSKWVSQITLVHETELLGTAGTILNNKDFFLGSGPFIIAHADNLTRFNVREFIKTHANRPGGVEITMMTFATDTPQSCGIVELDENNVVTAFHEKSPIFRGNHANGAVYIFEPSVIHFLETLNKKIIDLSTEVIPHYLGRIQTYHNAQYHRDIGTPESLQLAEMEY